MRKIDMIVVHCSATKEGKDLDASDVRQMHLDRGWKDIGYNYIIKLDGTIEAGRDLDKTPAHAKGFNKRSIGVVYIGGLDKNGKAKDTRTPPQDAAILRLLDALLTTFPNINKIVGHRDLSPDLNGDGIIQSNEFMKMCPCFDAKSEYAFLTQNR